MKAYKAIIALALTFSLSIVYGQHSFVVQNGTTAVYENITDAYDAANNGDTLYLPGGVFTPPGTIEKGLTWIGAGCHPDSTAATYFTQLNGNITFNGDCDDMSLTGIYFSGSMRLGSADGNHNENVSINKCYINSTLTLKWTMDTVDIGFKLVNSIIYNKIFANNASNCLIISNTIRYNLNRFHQSEISNNIFLGSGSALDPLLDNLNCLIKNNIFTHAYWNYNTSSGCTYKNNIFTYNQLFPFGDNTGENNIVDTGNDGLFILSSGATVWENDYHLDTIGVAGMQGIGAGTDGKNIGIYGGNYPWGDGMIPVNPHITAVSVELESDNGILPVEIKVGAQP